MFETYQVCTIIFVGLPKRFRMIAMSHTTQTMQGIWLEQHNLSFRTDLPVPQPAENEALVRVRMAGICATDVQLCQGYYPFTGILGHEFVGEIVTPHTRAGERVVGEINIGCGQCDRCQRGLPNHCAQRRVLGIKNHHGAFAEYLTLPLAQLLPIPQAINDEQAVFTEPLAAALAITQHYSILPQHKVLIIGAGKLGQLIAQVLRLSSADLHVCARYASQQTLLERANITYCHENELAPRSWDVVVEATGSATGLALALDCVCPRGMLVLKSTFAGTVDVPLARLVVDEIQLVGSRCGAFAPALRLLQQGLVHPEWLITHTFSLSDVDKAFTTATEKGVGKVLFKVS